MDSTIVSIFFINFATIKKIRQNMKDINPSLIAGDNTVAVGDSIYIKEYREDFYLWAGECNAEQEMSFPLLVTRLIDIATNHANHLHIGNADMTDINGGWVLSRLSIEMSRYPKVEDNYSITTWIESWNRHFSVRCFCIRDNEENVIGYARSVWMIIDITRHANLGLHHFNLPEVLISDRECPIATQKRKVMTENENFLSSRTYRFKYCDLDYYRHVNTVRYVVLLLNQFPLERFDSDIVSRFELSFLQEAKYGMEVAVTTDSTNLTEKGGEALISLKDTSQEDAKPLLLSLVRFQARPS